MDIDTIIRTAREDDLNDIVAFNLAMADETESKALSENVLVQGVSYLLKNPRFGFYLIAEIDNSGSREVVGCLMITFEWSDWRNGIFWWVQSVYVKPSYRRRGIYRALYSSVKERARAAKNVCGFRLYVEKENNVARNTYRSLGMDESHYLMFEEENVIDAVE